MEVSSQQPKRPALGDLLDELLAGWAQFVGDDGPELAEWRNRTEQQVVTIMTLTAHVHQTAMILRPVLPSGLTIAHMPLVRSLYEATLTACWCDEVADGTNGLLNEGRRQRRALRQSLANTRSMRDIADQISGTELSELPTASSKQARQMQERCRDLAFDGGYAIYRMLSSFSHPSVDTIDAYLDGESFQPGQNMSIKSNPGVLESSYAWSHLVACCLVWSGMVTNYLDKSRLIVGADAGIIRTRCLRPASCLTSFPHCRFTGCHHVGGRRAGASTPVREGAWV